MISDRCEKIPIRIRLIFGHSPKDALLSPETFGRAELRVVKLRKIQKMDIKCSFSIYIYYQQLTSTTFPFDKTAIKSAFFSVLSR